MEYPESLRYTQKHEWVLILKDTAVVGITDYAQRALGDVVFIQLPEIGTVVKKGEVFSVVESVKAASDIYAPLSGEVTEINTSLEDHPEYLNKSPYGDGWIAKIRIADQAAGLALGPAAIPSEAGGLLDSRAYEEFVKAEENAR
jgi:glycine cleavage system H protein